MDVTEFYDDEFLNADAKKVTIFLSVFNVHVNRLSLIHILGSDEGETRQIIGVAAGSKPTDAVNVAQLQNAFDALGGLDLTIFKDRLNNLDSKVNKAGAGAAALAALHPLDMDNKFDVSAAFGSYHDANALALGVFYRPTDNVMFSAGAVSYTHLCPTCRMPFS